MPDTAGDKKINSTQLIKPPYMLHSTPVVLNRFQNSEYRIVGRFAEAATAKASATRKATFWPSAAMPPSTASTPMTHAVMRATRTSLSASRLSRLITLA